MSLIWSIKRLFDPATHAREQDELEAEREQPRRAPAGDPPSFELAAAPPADEGPPPRFRCRVCGHESRSDAYCPACLADTMQPAVRSP